MKIKGEIGVFEPLVCLKMAEEKEWSRLNKRWPKAVLMTAQSADCKASPVRSARSAGSTGSPGTARAELII